MGASACKTSFMNLARTRHPCAYSTNEPAVGRIADSNLLCHQSNDSRRDDNHLKLRRVISVGKRMEMHRSKYLEEMGHMWHNFWPRLINAIAIEAGDYRPRVAVREPQAYKGVNSFTATSSLACKRQ
ncbi:hypothetical protein LIA77_02115 [Sarocladium implicatum]|nr:hypothetical protein LIA77_02115 [Sarocladium implicatum]